MLSMLNVISLVVLIAIAAPRLARKEQLSARPAFEDRGDFDAA